MNEQNTTGDGADLEFQAHMLSTGTLAQLNKLFETTTVWVRFTVEDWHCWENAPMHRAYLRNQHRHLFYVEVEASVSHNDRDIEFHDLLDAAKDAWLPYEERELGWSCEQIAQHIGRKLQTQGLLVCRVTVSEDNEVGATVRWTH